jgi:hypothetical protein
MAGSTLVDAGFLVALLSRRDSHRDWAVAQARRFPPPWKTCEAALSETFHLLGPPACLHSARCSAEGRQPSRSISVTTSSRC